MNRRTVKDARAEAQRFIARCDALLATQVEQYDHETNRRSKTPWDGIYAFSAPKQTAAARRASMDLTRALAEMRKPS